MPATVIFPVYTLPAADPVTICKAVDPAVFDYPFFNAGVSSLHASVAEHRHGYGLEDVPACGASEALAVRGFIFHTAHCGSTLLARMLGAVPGVRVVSETEAINGLLLAHVLYGLPEGQVQAHLKRIMEAYRQPMRADQYLIFKLTSWNVFFLPLFQQLYPHVPWLYIDRETEAVVRALLASGAGFVEWWHHPVDTLRRYFVGTDGAGDDHEAYLRKMIGLHRLHAHRYKNEGALFVSYPEFLSQSLEKILRHFRLEVSDVQMEACRELVQYDAKLPGRVLRGTNL